ncbi:MAG: hypothetical protein ACH350_00995 [Parachlamydiaceae bacterium]
MHNISDNSKQFTDLHAILRDIASSSNQGSQEKQDLYHDDKKVYISKRSDGTFISLKGRVGKASKEMSADRLASEVERIMREASEAKILGMKLKPTNDLDEMIAGMEVIKNRMIIAQKSVPTFIRVILQAFGHEDKFDVAIKKMNDSILIAKKHTLPRQIQKLKETESGLKTELDTLNSQRNPLLATQPHVQKTILELEKKVETITSNLSFQESESAQFNEELMQQSQQEAVLSREVKQARERVNDLKSQFGVSNNSIFNFFNGPSLSKEQQQKLASAEELKTSKKKELEFIQTSQVKLKKSQNTLIRSIHDNKEKKGKLNLELDVNKQTLKEIHLISSQIDGKQAHLKDISKQIQKLQTQLEEIENQLFDKKIKIEQTGKDSFKFDIPNMDFLNNQIPRESLSIGSKKLLEEIKAKIEPTSEDNTQTYMTAKRKLMFGLSIGQRTTLDSLASHTDFSVEDLQKLLEGGDTTDNMFYLSKHLDELIAKTERHSPQDVEFLSTLQSLQTDLKRSLDSAFINTLISRLNQPNPLEQKQQFAGLSAHIGQQLKEMKRGEKLYIPTSAGGHATLLVLQKQENGNILPIFYNTGEGVEEHMKKELSLTLLLEQINAMQNKFPTTLTFPSINLKTDQTRFESMMTNIFQMQMDRTKTTSDIHDVLRRDLGEGRSGKGKQIQINGICSFQVLSEAFNDALGKENYPKYQLDLLTSINEDFTHMTNPMADQTDKNKKEQTLLQLHEQMLEDLQKEIKEVQKRVK